MVTMSVARPLIAAGLASSERALPVLMYHSISDDPEAGVSPYYKTTTSREAFEMHVCRLSERGYQSVDLAEGLRLLNTKVPTTTKPVVITFDDGFRDFYDLAFPILKKHGQTAVMYLPTALIAGNRRSFKGRECMTWNEVRELREQGVWFGSHTVSHPKLYELSWREIEEELAHSKEHLERELNEEITGFAYPFAFPRQDQRFTDKFTQLLRQLGYRNCATTVVGRIRPGEDPFCTKRLPVNACDDQALFDAKLAGAYDWLAHPQNWSKTVRGWMGRGAAAAGPAVSKSMPSGAPARDSLP